jgi:hypothetical protein
VNAQTRVLRCSPLLELYKRKKRLVAPVCAVGVVLSCVGLRPSFRAAGSRGNLEDGSTSYYCLSDGNTSEEDVAFEGGCYSVCTGVFDYGSRCGSFRPRNGEISFVKGTPYE